MDNLNFEEKDLFARIWVTYDELADVVSHYREENYPIPEITEFKTLREYIPDSNTYYDLQLMFNDLQSSIIRRFTRLYSDSSNMKNLSIDGKLRSLNDSLDLLHMYCNHTINHDL